MACITSIVHVAYLCASVFTYNNFWTFGKRLNTISLFLACIVIHALDTKGQFTRYRVEAQCLNGRVLDLKAIFVNLKFVFQVSRGG